MDSNNKFNEFNDILSGCRTITDAHNFKTIYLKTYPDTESLVRSMVNGKRYEKIVDMKTMSTLLDGINKTQYKEDALQLIETCNAFTTDATQKKTFSRITNNKPLRPKNIMNITNPKNITGATDLTIAKNCPHCNSLYNGYLYETYVVCGYPISTKNGFDWKGCQRDWCFKCEKMLCKMWTDDQLFVETNRVHDVECCKKHAKINNKIYPDDYCQCEKMLCKIWTDDQLFVETNRMLDTIQ